MVTVMRFYLEGLSTLLNLCLKTEPKETIELVWNINIRRKITFDLSEGLPVVTTKKIHLHAVIEELLVYGDSNVRALQEKGVTIWDECRNGNLGPIYGKQWRKWTSTNSNGEHRKLIKSKIINQLRTNPQSRRHMFRPGMSVSSPRWLLPPVT